VVGGALALGAVGALLAARSRPGQPLPRPRPPCLGGDVADVATGAPDAGNPIAESSPSEATLDAGGPAVVVGDRAGGVYAYHLSNGSAVSGWPAHAGGPIDSTPSVAPDGAGTDNVYVGAGNAAQPRTGGYDAFNARGSQLWEHNAQDPNGLYGVQASMAVGNLGGVTAPSPLARAGRVRPQCGQRRSPPRLALLHG